MSNSVYDIGDTAVILIQFQALSAAPFADPPVRALATPTTAICKIQPPTLAAYTETYPSANFVLDAVGKLHVLVACLESGTYSGRVTSTGTAAGSEEFTFAVRARAVA